MRAAVGTAKSGWVAALSALGGKAASWYNRTDTGTIDDKSGRASDPYIKITNKVSYIASLDKRMKIVDRARTGRANDMIKSLKKQLELAARAAGF